jgi:hypothetical protein
MGWATALRRRANIHRRRIARRLIMHAKIQLIGRSRTCHRTTAVSGIWKALSRSLFMARDGGRRWPRLGVASALEASFDVICQSTSSKGMAS